MTVSYFNSERYADPTAFAALSNIEHEEKRKYRPLIYICSPFSGDVAGNIAAAQQYCRKAVEMGYIPLAPHLLYPQFLDDGDADERELGLFFGKVLLDKCMEVWVCGERVSAGMQAEIERAQRKHYTVRYFNSDMKEVNK